MADELETISANVAAVGASAEGVTASLDKMINAANQGVSKAIEFYGKVASTVELFGSGAGVFDKSIGDYFNTAQDSASTFIASLKSGDEEAKKLLVTMGLFAEPFAKILPVSSNVFGRVTADGKEAATAFGENFARIKPILDKVFDKDNKMIAFIQAHGEASEKAKQLEMALLRSAAASGDLNAMLGASGEKLSTIGGQTASFAEVTYNVAKATGMSIPAVSEYALSLAAIPGALRDVVNVQGSAVSSMNLMEASLKVGTAYGLDNKTVVDLLSQAYRELGTTGTDAVSIIARIGSAAQDLKMPMDILQKYTMDVANQFKIMGDNSQAAINIMDKMSGALQDSGLGPQAIADVTKGMIDGIKGMDVATKAFMSGASGGKGGLAGAFEIDFMIQQGQLDKVSEMVSGAMQKQFGKVVTLEDANKDPGKSGELLKQVEYLKQVAGIAKTNEEAYRILEAMKKGDQIPTTKTPEEALKASIDLGTSIQDKQYNVLNVISNELDKLVQIQALQSRDLLEKYTGATGDTSIAEMLASMKTSASKDASTRGAIGVTGAQATSQDEMKLGSAESLGGGWDAAKGAFSDLGGYMTSLLKKSEEMADKAKGNSGKATDQSPGVPKPEVTRNIRPQAPLVKSGDILSPVQKAADKKADGQDTDRKQLLDGTLRIMVDVKDGIKVIATEVFDTEWKKIINTGNTGTN